MASAPTAEERMVLQMTDNEIVKALRCCGIYKGRCNECPYKDDRDCLRSHALDTINLINRQKAEIERLTNRNFELSEKGEAVCIAYKTAKAEAIKEFAEKVKMEFYTHFDELIPSIMADKIDSLVEEMVGENGVKALHTEP